jgi:hypothetical protein
MRCIGEWMSTRMESFRGSARAATAEKAPALEAVLDRLTV